MNSDVIIVDSNDQPIGAKQRSLIASENIYRVAALWITNSRGDVLLAQRRWTKKNDPGKWGPAAAGTVEVGETYESNIYKEAMEEVGLSGITFTLGPKTFSDGEHKHFTQWFLATLNWPIERFVTQEEELEGLAWTPRSQLTAELAATPEKFIPQASRWAELFLS